MATNTENNLGMGLLATNIKFLACAAMLNFMTLSRKNCIT